MVRSAKRVSNHEATTRASSFETLATQALQDEGLDRCLCIKSALRKCLLDHELRRLTVIAFDKTLAVQQRAGVRDQCRAAADHDAVMRGLERGQPDIGKQLA